MAIETNLTDERIDKHITERSWLNLTCNDWFERNVRAWPNKLAVIDYRSRVTNAELDIMVRRIALSLLEFGIRKEDIVGIMLPNRIEYVASLLAIQKISAVPMPLNYDFRVSDLHALLSFTQPVALITTSDYKGRDLSRVVEEARQGIPSLEYVILDGENIPEGMISFKELTQKPIEGKYRRSYLDLFKSGPNDICLMLLTSGTTGIPKGALHVHNAFASGSYAATCSWAIRPDDVYFSMVPWFGGSGNYDIGQALTQGNTLVGIDGFSAEHALKIIEGERPTYAWAVATQYIDILNDPDFKDYDVSSLRLLVSGGAPLHSEVAKRLEESFNARILQGWGTSETMGTTSTLYTDPPEVIWGTVGRPLPNQELKIVDPKGEEIPPNEPGEIITRGPLNFVGYFKNAELNRKCIDSEGWFHTGDEGIVDEEGNLKIVGRITDMILRGGENIYPQEIEGILCKHPKVKDVAVVGMPDDRLGEKVCVYIVPKSGETVTFDEMVSFLKDKVTTHKIPERLEIIERFPMTDAGKILKTKLREDIANKLNAKRKG